MKNQILAVFGIVFLLALLVLPMISAVSFDDDISDEDRATFDEILQPVMKIYNLIKYVATVVAVIVILFAGITYITSGSNAGKREQAKNMIMYVVIGLIVIWGAPLIVNFIVG